MAFLLRPFSALSSLPAKNIRCLSSTSFINQLHERNISVKLDKFDHEMRKIDSILKHQRSLSKYDIEQVVESLKDRSSVSLHQSLNLLRACQCLYPIESTESSRDVVSKVWNAISQCYVNLDISHFNALLQVYIEIGHEFSVDDFLSDLSNKGLEPNRVTLQLIIHKYCQDGNTDEAAKIVAKMKEKQMPVNRDIFNCFIMGYNKLKDIQSAEEIITLMKQSGLEPSHSTYTMLMQGYAAQGNVKEIEDIAIKCDVIMNTNDHLKIFHEMIVNGYEKEALNYLQSQISNNRTSHNDFVHSVIRLVNCEREKHALQVIQLLTEENVIPDYMLEVVGAFLKQMIKVNKPIDEVLDYCCKISENKWCCFHTESVLEELLIYKNYEDALKVLNALKDKNLGELRPQYFLPFMIHYSNENLLEEFNSILEQMKDLNMEILDESTNIIVQSMMKLEFPFQQILESLKNLGVDKKFIVNAMAHHYFSRHELPVLVKAVQSMNTVLHGRYTQELITSTIKTRDAKNSVLLLNCMLKSNGAEGSDDNIHKITRYCTLLNHQSKDEELISNIFKEMDNLELGLPTNVIEMLKAKLTTVTPELEETLNNLQQHNTLRTNIHHQDYGKVATPRRNSPEHLFEDYNHRISQGFPSGRMYVQLIFKCIEERKADLLVSLLKTEDVQLLKSGIFARIISTLVNQGYLEDAKYALDEMERINPGTYLNLAILLNFASELGSKGKSEEMMSLLTSHLNPRSSYNDNGATILRHVNNFFSNVSPSINIETMKNISELFANNGFPSGQLEKFEIMSAIQNGNLQDALNLFKNIAANKKVMPAKHQLQCVLINKEDSEMLQEVIEISMNITNEMKSLHDLAVSFLCCGRKLQAEKIFKSAGMQADNIALEQQCQFIYRNEEAKVLEDLLEVTKDLFNCDRNMIYKYLLMAYKKVDNVEKVIDIWTSIQEENCQISDELMQSLAQYLGSKQVILPFMEHLNYNYSNKVDRKMTEFPTRQSPVLVENYKDELKALMNSDKDFRDIAIGVREKVMTGIYSSQHLQIIRLLVDSLVDKGDVESLNLCNKTFTGGLSAMTDRSVVKCYLNEGKTTELLNYLESLDINEDTHKVSNMLSVDLIKHIYNQQEEMDTVNALCEKLKQEGNSKGFTNLLSAHLIKESYKSADDILKNKLEDCSNVQLNFLIQSCVQSKNENPLKYLLNNIENNALVQHNKNLLENGTIRILMAKGNLKEARDIYSKSTGDLELSESLLQQLLQQPTPQKSEVHN